MNKPTVSFSTAFVAGEIIMELFFRKPSLFFEDENLSKNLVEFQERIKFNYPVKVRLFLGEKLSRLQFDSAARSAFPGYKKWNIAPWLTAKGTSFGFFKHRLMGGMSLIVVNSYEPESLRDVGLAHEWGHGFNYLTGVVLQVHNNDRSPEFNLENECAADRVAVKLCGKERTVQWIESMLLRNMGAGEFLEKRLRALSYT